MAHGRHGTPATLAKTEPLFKGEFYVEEAPKANAFATVAASQAAEPFELVVIRAELRDTVDAHLAAQLEWAARRRALAA